MRKNQPSFVVEYKGGRRQKRTSTTSIWGAIDLSSLQKEIDQDLFPVTGDSVSGVASEIRQSVERRVPQKDRVSLDVDNQPGSDASTSSALSKTGAIFKRENHRDTNDGKLKPKNHQVEETGTRETSPVLGALKPEVDPIREDLQSASVSISAVVTHKALSVEPVSRQHLAQLETDNAELKHLYRTRLMDEHRYLLEKLRRFELA